MSSRRWWMLLLPLATACSSKDSGGEPAESAPAKRAEPVRAASAAESSAAARDEWSKAEVIKRMIEAGLVVVDSQKAASDPKLAAKGGQLIVSGSVLRLFIYADAAARAAESASLDTNSLRPGVPAPLPDRPRYVISNNMIAIYVTPNDRLAERIENVLLARHRRTP